MNIVLLLITHSRVLAAKPTPASLCSRCDWSDLRQILCIIPTVAHGLTVALFYAIVYLCSIVEVMFMLWAVKNSWDTVLIQFITEEAGAVQVRQLLSHFVSLLTLRRSYFHQCSSCCRFTSSFPRAACTPSATLMRFCA